MCGWMEEPEMNLIFDLWVRADFTSAGISVCALAAFGRFLMVLLDFLSHVYLTWLTVMKIHRRITIVNMWIRTGNVSCDVK